MTWQLLETKCTQPTKSVAYFGSILIQLIQLVSIIDKTKKLLLFGFTCFCFNYFFLFQIPILKMVNVFSLKIQGQNNKNSFIQIYLLNELSNIKSKGIEISPQNMINISHLFKEINENLNSECHLSLL